MTQLPFCTSDAPSGARLFLRVIPNARADEISGLWRSAEGEVRLGVRVAAPPDKGKANASVLKLLSRRLGLPKSALSITAGETGRLKTILVTGEIAALVAQLKKIVGDNDEC